MAWFARPDDDYAPRAIAVTASAEDPDYPASNSILDNPADPAQLTTTTGWILYEFADKIQPVLATLVYQYLLAGLNVRLQASATSDFSSPAVNLGFTIPAKRRDGPSFQRWTTNASIEIDVDAFPDPDGYKFWRVNVVGTNNQNVIIGKVMLLSVVRPVDLFHEAGKPTERDYDPENFIDLKTEAGVRYVETLTGPQRFLAGGFVGTDLNAGTAPVQEASEFRDLLQSIEGIAHPFWFAPFAITDPWLVTSETPAWERTHEPGGHQIWPFAVREVSRGIPWP